MEVAVAGAEVGMTSIADLEYSLVQKILSYINDPDSGERQRLRHVCKLWYDVINSEFGIKLVVNNLNHSILKLCGDYVTALELNSLTMPIDVDKLEFRHRLRSLTFYNIVVTYNLFPLLASMVNLTDLSFHDTMLDLPENLVEIPVSSDKHELGTFNIQKLHCQNWNFSPSLVSLLSLLSKLEFKRLAELQVVTTFTPYIPFHKVFMPAEHSDATLLHPFVRLIVNNLATLEFVSYGPKPNPTKFKFHKDEYDPVVAVKQIEELSIVHFSNPEYASLLVGQTKLHVLELGCCKFETWNNIRNCIVTNASTLKKIYLKSFTFGQPWNCDVFTNVNLLESLALHMNASPKTNLQSLPVSLRTLVLDGTLTREELGSIYHLTNLEQLELLLLGLNLLNILPESDAEDGERIGLNQVKLFIIRLPKLRTLTFKECSLSSLDWDRITNWLNNEAPNYGIQVELFHYDVEGRRTIHGFSLRLPENVRTNIAIGIEDEPRTRGDRCMIEEASDALATYFRSE